MDNIKIIFFGNGPLADYALAALKRSGCEIIFHAKTKSDLETVKKTKFLHPEAHGVLASFGVIIKKDVLDLFEPEGILNIHPSPLPKYRGPSPIETAILNGDTTISVSVMKLVPEMDAGPVYFVLSCSFDENTPKDEIYHTLATRAVEQMIKHIRLAELICPLPQKGKPSYTHKFDKSMSPLDPKRKNAKKLHNQVRAFAGFPKSKYEFFGIDCTIISAHVATDEEKTAIKAKNTALLSIRCYDGSFLIVDEIQPAGRKIMDAKSFINGYGKNKS